MDEEKYDSIYARTENTDIDEINEAEETFNEEDLAAYFEEARTDYAERARQREAGKKPKGPFRKWIFWLISFALLINLIAVLPQTLSIPAIDFLITSAKLSKDADVKGYKESVAVIKAGNSKGTGFIFDVSGELLTNYHVIEGHTHVQVSLPDHGFFEGEVIETYPEIDLAVVKITAKDLPALQLAAEFVLHNGEQIYFIGNPLNFIGIANQGHVLDYTGVESKSLPVVMIDAPVYRGNSGSPVINMAGEVIGIVYATTVTDAFGKVGLFVPINQFLEARLAAS